MRRAIVVGLAVFVLILAGVSAEVNPNSLAGSAALGVYLAVSEGESIVILVQVKGGPLDFSAMSACARMASKFNDRPPTVTQAAGSEKRLEMCGYGVGLKFGDRVILKWIKVTGPVVIEGDKFVLPGQEGEHGEPLFVKEEKEQQASGDELTSMPDGTIFYFAEKLKSDPVHFRNIYVIRPFLNEGADSSTVVAGALCSDMAYKMTHDPVNLNIEKKIYECVVGKRGLRVGSLVHSFNRVVKLEEVRNNLARNSDAPYWFLVVEPGE